MNRQTRLELTDTTTDIALKMSEGNPGALRVIVELLQEGDRIDPIGMGGVGALLSADTFGIYGSRIWMLYKDVCSQDITKTMGVLRACQLGIIPESVLKNAIDGSTTLNTDDLVKQVRERLGTFGEKAEAAQSYT